MRALSWDSHEARLDQVTPEIIDALQQLSSFLASEAALEKALDRVAELTVSCVPGCDSAGVTLRVAGNSIEPGEIFAKQATIALGNAQAYIAGRKLADQLNEALETREVIGQAKGVLMAREDISDAEAFELLKTISQNTNVKLAELARKLVEERTSDPNQ